jgi:hypothetical protein
MNLFPVRPFIAGFAIGAAAMILPASSVKAQNCAPTGQVNDVLSRTYGESVVFEGLTNNHQFGRLFLNPVSGSWTFVVDLPSGLSCLVASGEMGTTSAPTAPGDPA